MTRGGASVGARGMGRAARCALIAIGLLLVGVMADCANIEVLNFRLPLLIKIAKIAVPGAIKRSVQEASFHKYELVPLGDLLIYKVIGGFEIEIESIESNSWVGDATALPCICILTKLQTPGQLGCDDAISVFREGRAVWRSIPYETQRRFTSRVLVQNSYLNRLADGGLTSESGICWPNPGALRTDNCLGCGFSLPDGRLGLFCHSLSLALGSIGSLSSGIGGLLGSLSLLSDRFINLYHFVNLPADGGKRESYKNDGDPFPTSFSAILALLFFAIGNAFIFYGVYKSDKIGGWGALVVFCGFPFILLASIFLISGVLNWAGGLSAWGL